MYVYFLLLIEFCICVPKKKSAPSIKGDLTLTDSGDLSIKAMSTFQ